jgi:hypothetical protein
MLLCPVKVEFGVLEEPPDSSGDDPFEASGGFAFSLAFAGASSHVVLGDRAAALAGDGDEVERSVELAITAAIESVSVLVLAGGDLDGCGAAESGVCGFAVAAPTPAVVGPIGVREFR